MAVQTLVAKDVNSSRLARCYTTIDNKKYLLMMAKNLEANVEIEKQDVPILGRTGMGHKSTSWNGTGSMTVYYVTSMFTKLMKKFKDEQKETFFDIQIINEDPTSDSGMSDITLKDCSINGGVIAAFDADGEWLEQDIDFSFEDYTIPTEFTPLKGMNA